jgi:hypothetical protein
VACTLIGADSGIFVRSDEGAGHRLTVCLEDRCDTGSGNLIDTGLRGAGPVRIRVIVRGQDGEVLSRFDRRERLSKFEPNGPGCGTWWRAMYRVTVGGAVERVNDFRPRG